MIGSIDVCYHQVQCANTDNGANDGVWPTEFDQCINAHVGCG